jgi:Mechanosensitive ion channel, conserved TM helix
MMEGTVVMSLLDPFLDSLRAFWLQLSTILPKVAGAVVLLTIGWLIARLIRRGTIKALKLVRVDVLSEKSGIEDFLLQGGVRYTAVTLIANMLYWFVLFTFVLAILSSLGLTSAADLFNKMLLYIPNVIVALLLLMFGTVFAKFVQGVSFTYLNNIGISGAQIMSAIAQWAILLFVISAALEQLSIGGQVLVSAFQIAFGAICLALALAFGLGGKDWAAHILEKVWKK